MGRRWTWLLLCAVGVGLVLGLAACMELFSGAGTPTLILGEVRMIDGRGEILLSVKDMPDGGLASFAVHVTAIEYPQSVTNVVVEGLNGFEVLAEQFADGNPGEGGFYVGHASAGLKAGEFAKLAFDVSGAVTLAEFDFIKSGISMGDDDNNLISPLEIKEAYHYYAK